MGAFAVPAPGEPFLGDAPGAMKVARITFGDANADVRTSASGVWTDSDSSEAVTLLNFEAGGFRVYDMQVRVITAFPAGTTITIGDSVGNADSWFTSAMVGPTTAAANLMSRALGDSSSSRAAGFFTSVSGTITLTQQPGASTDVTGLLEVLVWYTYGIGGV